MAVVTSIRSPSYQLLKAPSNCGNSTCTDPGKQFTTLPMDAPRLESPGNMSGSPDTMNGLSTGTVWPSALAWSKGLLGVGRRTRASLLVSQRLFGKPASRMASRCAWLVAVLNALRTRRSAL